MIYPEVHSPTMELTVPCLPEFVSVVRLAVLGLCGRLPFSYDEVEDLRLAVGEACASSVQRAAQEEKRDARITVTGDVSDRGISLTIQDNVPLPPQAEASEAPSLEAEFDDENFRVSLMQLLVDQVLIDEADGGQVVRLVKECHTGSNGNAQ